ncbi:MAG: hypothetical protein Q9191_006680 [Dirinaria sp. TL-2023a]
METTQKRTRNRELLSCSECRRRKLKCDRNFPCLSCTRRRDEASCTYERAKNGLERERERRLQAEARLEHLERLVQQWAQHGDGSAAHDNTVSGQLTDQHVNQEEPSMESNAPSSDGLVFNGSTHWSAMLEDIQGLRSIIVPGEAGEPDDDICDRETDIGSSIILGSESPLSFQQVLNQHLPSRQEADRLTAAYFRSRGVVAPFIHASYFRRYYQEFWKDPLKAPPLWVSILFSICHIARNTLSLGQANVYADNRYEIASAHCLALGEYFRPKKFSVESLLLYAQAKCMTGLGVSLDVGLIFGLIVRLATRMGYHRDPSIFQLSVFEGEMRRRTWSLCMQLDVLISFQLGLPSNIQFPTWDTQPPRNLLDSDFDEDTEALPPTRPDSEVTDIHFYNAKHKLVAVFEKVHRHIMTTGLDGSADVDKLDIEIRNTYSTFPTNLRPLPISDSTVDSPSLIVTRLCLSFLYHKCLCVLHRPYVTRGRVHSIELCCDAASNIVRCVNDTYEEFLPGGQLETQRWFMSSITWHDYLFGVMALCLVLCATSQTHSGVLSQSPEIIELLQRARDICVDGAVRSRDCRRVQRVVNATLLRFGVPGGQNQEFVMNKSNPSTNDFGPSSLQTPVMDDLANGHTDLLPRDLPEFLPEQTETDWTGSEAVQYSLEDSSWAYLGQFLNLSDGALMPG